MNKINLVLLRVRISFFNYSKESPQTLMLIKCESLNLLPCRMGVIKEEGDDTELKI